MSGNVVLGFRGTRSLTFRSIVSVTLISLLAGPLHLSAFAASDGPGKPAKDRLETDVPWALPVRVAPAKLAVLEGGADEATLGRLFDGRETTGLSSRKPVRFRAHFLTPTTVDAIGVWGPADGTLAVAADTPSGSVEIAPSAALGGGAATWNRRETKNAPRARSLTITWTPSSDGAFLRELEIWGRPASTDAVAAPLLPDALYQGTPAVARELRAREGEQTIAASRPSASFTVSLDDDPRVFERAFLVYELAGLPHFTAARRAVNGMRRLGGFAASPGAKGGLQVEEIEPTWLHAGINRVEFFPADEHGTGSYRVRALRIVGVPAEGARLTDASARAWASLRDGKEASGWSAKAGSSDARDLAFTGLTQPQALDLRLPDRARGTLTISAAAGGANGKIAVRLDDLKAGWHRVPLGRLPATDHLTVTLAADREDAVALSELSISGSPLPIERAPRLVVSYPLSGECVDHKIHVRGFVEPADAATLYANGAKVSRTLTDDGAFGIDLAETDLAKGADGTRALNLEAAYPNGTRVRRAVSIGKCFDRPPVVVSSDGRPRQPVDDVGAPYGVTVRAGERTRLAFDGVRLNIPAGAVEKDVRLTIRPLPPKDLPPLDAGMTNVTPGGQAFRFGPLGMLFKKPVQMALPYDKKLIPAGYGGNDVRTFYYDELLGRWEQVALVGQDEGEMQAVTEHFTDFINATISMPEHPGPQSLNPTSIKNMKLADPAASIPRIEPPTPGPSGTADLTFPIEVPPGRRGLQPTLTVAYNNEASNGWLGVGWDVKVPSIEIDTRFGVPRYQGDEVYTIDGATLTPIGNGLYQRRVEGSFDRIERLGTGPSDYSWKVTDKNGTVFVYGASPSARLFDPVAARGSHIFRWYLESMTDTYGNRMSYTYASDNGNNGEPFTQVYPASIDYTSNVNTGLSAGYHVLFRLDQGAPRADAFINAKCGFQTLTRRLLSAIEVRVDLPDGTNQLIRRYGLDYVDGAFAKKLLSSITMVGADGATSLFSYNFSYTQAPPTNAIFAPVTTWAQMKQTDGSTVTERSSDGLTRNDGDMSGMGASFGFGLGPFHITAGGGVMGGSDKTRMRAIDVNGDGIEDYLDDSNGANISIQDPPDADHLRCSVTPPAGVNPYLVGHTNRSGWNFSGSLGIAAVANITGGYSQTSAEDDTLLTDIDGDGFVDEVFLGNQTVMARRNDGTGNFTKDGSGISWGEVSLDNRSTEVAAWNNPTANANQYGVETLTRWRAPFSGQVSLSGDISKVRAGGDGVHAKVFVNAETSPRWDGVVNDATPTCTPGSASGCPGGGSPLSFSVTGGDRIYLLVDPIADIKADDINWNPTFTYDDFATRSSWAEPYGAPTYRFAEASDFRLYGFPDITWVAIADGTIQFSGILQKQRISDDVRVEIQKSPHAQTPPAPISVVNLDADAPSATDPNAISEIPLNLTFTVHKGEEYRLQAVADTTVDSHRVLFKNPQFTYVGQFCRETGKDRPPFCGPLELRTTDGRTITTVTPGDQIVSGRVQGDTVTMDALAVNRQVEPFFPRRELLPLATLARTFVSGTSHVAGTASVPINHPAVTVFVQGVNRLYAKAHLGAGQSLPVSFDATDDQLFFTVISDTDTTTPINWSPTVGGANATVNYLAEDTEFYKYDPLRNPIKFPNPMSGGYHSWFFGDFDATVAFSEANLTFPDVTRQRNNFMFCGPVSGMVDDPTDPNQLPSQRYQCRGLDAFIGAGVQKPSKQSTGIGDAAKLRSLRIAETSNVNLGASVTILNGAAGWGSTVSTLEFTDMNGDRYPDSVAGGGIRYSNGVLFSGGDISPAPVPYGDSVSVDIGQLRDVEHRNIRGGVSISTSFDDNGELLNLTDSAGNSEGVISTNLGVGAGVDYGASSGKEDLIDMNGDGLPDKVSQAATSGRLFVRLNLGYSFGQPIEWGNAAHGFSATDFGFPSSILSDIPDFDEVGPNALSMQDSLNNSITAGGGVGFAGASAGDMLTTNRTMVQYLDLNSDGLPDKVMKKIGSDPDQILVMINKGTSFLSPTPWTLPDDWGVGDLNPHGVFEPPQDFLFSQDPHALSFGRQEGWEASLNVQICFVLCVGVNGFTSGTGGWTQMEFEDIDGDNRPDHVLKMNGNTNVYAKLNLIKNPNMLSDVAGPLGDTMHLDYQQVGHFVGASPTAGDPAIDMPAEKWVLTKVRTGDGRGNFYTNQINYNVFSPLSADDQAATGNPPAGPATGFYARDEREDYGYFHVETTRGVKVGSTWTEGDGSQLEQFFYNQDYYLKQKMQSEFELDSSGHLFRGTIVNVPAPPLAQVRSIRTGTYFPPTDEKLSVFYEGTLTKDSIPAARLSSTGLAPKYRDERHTLDARGNLLTYSDSGDESTSADDLLFTIGYDAFDPSTNITRANDIVAKRGPTGPQLRHRSATFVPGKGVMATLTNFINGGKVPATGAPYSDTASTFSFTYDAQGNLATSTDPNQYAITYTYDAPMQIHRTRIVDSFNYASTATPNYLYGANAQVVDINGQPESFVFDNFGRLSQVFGPTDQGAAEPTIAMTYDTATFPASASTKHKDVQHPGDPIETVSFIDGLRRAIQSKKDQARDVLGDGNVQQGMAVSGQITFDTRGRVAAHGQPVFDTGPAAAFVVVPMKNPTTFTYDVIDRPLTENAPDGSAEGISTTTVYSFVTPSGADALGDNTTWFLKSITDAQGNRRLSYSDARGNRVAVREFNTIGTSTSLSTLTTRYAYDPLSQLLGVTDTKGNVVSAEYDSLGQMVALTSPDSGRTEYRYDLAGNVGAKQTAVLAAQNQLIRFQYDFDRLRAVVYPSLPTVNYTYGAATEGGDAAGNLAGRIKSVTMEAGTEQRFYDQFGNVNRTVTTLDNLSHPNNPTTITFNMRFSHDWMGRMQTMTFPNWMEQNADTFLPGEGELVSYFYDGGGSLDRITGHHQTPNPIHPDHPTDFTYLSHVGYDEFHQRTAVVSGNGIANKYRYEPETRRMSDINADTFGSLEQSKSLPPTPFQRIHYTYDKIGNILHMVNNVSVQDRPGGVFVGPLDVTYTYDNLHQLRSLSGKYRPRPEYGYQYSNTYTYDELGNIKTKAQSEDRLLWADKTFDTNDPNPVVNQLAGSRFDHNVGALTYSVANTFNGPRPHAASAVTETRANGQAVARTYTYDANGNVTGNTFKGDQQGQVWDEENRLKQVTKNGGTLATYRYNQDGERVKKDGLPNGTDTWYLNQFYVLLPNHLPTKHIFAGDTRVISKTDAVQMAEPVITYYHPDNIGSTGYTSGANQDLLQHERYFAFGEMAWAANEGELSNLGHPDNLRRNWTFASKEFDEETSLYYFGARYFDPHANIWQSPDPLLGSYIGGAPNGGVYLPQNLGVYTYSWNNPVVMKDPDGRFLHILAGAAIGAVIGGGGRALANYLNDRPISEGVFASAAGGAVTGGLAAATGGASLGMQLVGGGIAAVEGGMVERAIEHGINSPTVTDPKAMATDFLGGAAGAAGAAVVSKLARGAGQAARSVATEEGAAASKGLRRPYIRKWVRAEVEARAPRDPQGRPIDPNTKQPIQGKPDLGHKTGNEFWREKARAEAEGLTQKQFNDRMNNPDLYQLEDASSNRSHAHEQKR